MVESECCFVPVFGKMSNAPRNICKRKSLPIGSRFDDFQLDILKT